MTKLKAFADDNIDIAKMTISLCSRLENTVGKEENAGYKHFLLFPTVFFKAFLRFIKVWITWFNPLPDNKILQKSNLKQSADHNFKFDENSRKFSKWVENTVNKGEILLFPQSFQKACLLGASKGVIVREWVKELHLGI